MFQPKWLLQWDFVLSLLKKLLQYRYHNAFQNDWLQQLTKLRCMSAQKFYQEISDDSRILSNTRSFIRRLKKLKFLGTKVTCTLWWHHIEGTWLYGDYFIWCVSCTVVILTSFVICEFVYVWVSVGDCMYELCNMWMCVCVGVLVICVLVLTVFLYSFVYLYLFLFFTSVRTSATEKKLNCSK
jgi:hypothetical protein